MRIDNPIFNPAIIEQGTWTPTLFWQDTGGTYTMTGSNGGRYTKIGNLVHLQAELEWNGFTGSTGTYLAISGLPFTSVSPRTAGVLGAIPAGSISFSSTSFTTMLLVLDAGLNHIWMVEQGSTSYTHAPTVSTSGAIYGLSLTYLI